MLRSETGPDRASGWPPRIFYWGLQPWNNENILISVILPEYRILLVSFRNNNHDSWCVWFENHAIKNGILLKILQFWGNLWFMSDPLQWSLNGRNSVSNHQPHDCLLNRLFKRKSKKISKLRVTGLSAGNSPVPGEFPAQMASNVENVFIWWHHHVTTKFSVNWTQYLFLLQWFLFYSQSPCWFCCLDVSEIIFVF